MNNDPPRPLAIKPANFKKIWSGNHTLLVHIFSVADFRATRNGKTEFVLFSVCFQNVSTRKKLADRFILLRRAL